MQTFTFEMEAEEKLLQETLNKAFRKLYPPSDLKELIEKNSGSEQIYQFLSDQGLLGILNSRNNDEDMNLSICAILMTEIGKRLISFPVSEHLLGLFILKQVKTLSDISSYESGEKIVTVSWKEDLKLTNQNGEHLVNGSIKSIPFAEIADTLVIPVKRKEESSKDFVLIIDAAQFQNQYRKMNSMDLSYPLYELSLQELNIDHIAMELVEFDLEEFNKIADLLISAELLGIMEEVLEMTIDYAKERRQFGDEIGKFQAIKHMLADMHLLAESSKVAIEYGSWSLENEGEDADIISSMMKAYSADATIRIVQDAIQIHGGVGMTWEHNLHFYLKRAFRLGNMFKTPVEEREKLAKSILDQHSLNFIKDEVGALKAHS